MSSTFILTLALACLASAIMVPTKVPRIPAVVRSSMIASPAHLSRVCSISMIEGSLANVTDDYRHGEKSHSTAKHGAKPVANIFARRASRLNRAGMATVERQLHYLSGILSLLIGTADFLQVTALGYDHAISAETCLVHGAVHTLSAALALPRFDWKGFPFEGREIARRASMWPSFFLAAFATLVCGTEWTMAPSEAILHIQSAPMQTLAWLNLALLGYITVSSYVTGGEVNPNSGLLYDSRLANLLGTAGPMVLAFAPEVARAIYMSGDKGFDAYTSLLAAYPSMAFLCRNNALNNGFASSFFSFLATAKHYEILTPDQNRAVTFGLNGLLTIGIFKSFFFDIGTGFPQAYIDVLVWQPLVSAMG